MAVETKIGLVVGLGFITCFAVVLSHRGSGDQLSARMAYDLLSKQDVSPRPKPIAPPETHTRRQARKRQVGDTRSERRREASAPQARDSRARARTKRNPGANRRSSIPSSGERNKKTTRSQGGQRTKDTSARRGPAGKRAARDGAVTRRNGTAKKQIRAEDGVNGSPGVRNAGKVARQSKKGLPSFEALFGGVPGERDEIEKNAKRQAGSQAARRATKRGAQENPTNTKKRPANTKLKGRSLNRETSTSQRVASRVDAAAEVSKDPKRVTTGQETRTKSSMGNAKTDRKPPPARYVVRARDTLWRISERMYGVGSRRIVDAIFAANKDRLTSAERLRVGVELVLPAIDGVGAAKFAGQQNAKRTSKVASAPERPRYYQIQNGDRYSTIAERFLGSKSRWKEIHEMNKDIFPDPGKIRYGVRIRLPSSALLARAS